MKKVLLAGLGALMASGAYGAPLTPEQALERLQSMDGRMGKIAASRLERVPSYTAKSENGTAAAYVFKGIDGKGFKVLSADDCAYAVLGYSDESDFNAEEMAPGFKWWLEETARIITANASRGISTTTPEAAGNGQPAIAPQVSSKWNQDSPYNQNAPMIGNSRCYTGCVATSMAQVMYYHKYPAAGTGENSYFWNKGSKRLEMDFSQCSFDWSNMIDVYQRGAYSQAQADAVAALMQACGYSVNMNYGTDASGTQGVLIANALKKYFNYDGNLNAFYRMSYSAAEWDQKVYNNLKECGPVIFNGHPYEDGGHSFICDGYDGKGYYHFNWGWGGVSDGYYLLESMNPEAQGIGGAGSTGFVYGLNGIFGIRKPTGDPVVEIPDNMLMYGGCTATISGNTIKFMRNKWYPDGWFNATDHKIDMVMGAIFEPIDGTTGETVWQGGTFMGGVKFDMTPGTYYPGENGPTVVLPTFADGRYKATVAVLSYKQDNAKAVPILTSYGCANYVILNVSNGTITVENQSVPNLEPENAKLNSALYYGKNCSVDLTLKNESQFDFTQTIAVGLKVNGAVKLMTGGIPVTVSANSTETSTHVVKFGPVNGFSRPTADVEAQLVVIDPITSEVLGEYDNVTLKPMPKGNLILDVKKFYVNDVESVTEENDGKRLTYYPVSTADFTTTLEYSVFSGFFDGTLMVGLYEVNPENTSDIMPLQEGIFQTQPFLEAGQEQTLTIPIQFDGARTEKLYMLRVSYTVGSSDYSLRTLNFKVLTAGIDGIGAEENEAPARYYNLQGVELKNPQSGDIVIEKRGSKSRKLVWK